MDRRRFLGAVPLAPALCRDALAQGEPEFKQLRGATLEYPPLAQVESGRVAGVAAELAQVALERGGWQLKLEVFPWLRAQEMVAAGERDCLLTAFRTAEREKRFDFSEQPLLRQPIALFARQDRRWTWRGRPQDLRGLRAAVTRGVNHGTVFESLAGQIGELSKTERIQAPFLMLAHRRVDVTVANVFLACHVLREHPSLWHTLEMLHPVLEYVPSFMAFTKGRHNLSRSAFDANIEQVRDLLLRPLLQRYGVPPEWWAAAMG